MLGVVLCNTNFCKNALPSQPICGVKLFHFDSSNHCVKCTMHRSDAIFPGLPGGPLSPFVPLAPPLPLFPRSPGGPVGPIGPVCPVIPGSPLGPGAPGRHEVRIMFDGDIVVLGLLHVPEGPGGPGGPGCPSRP